MPALVGVQSDTGDVLFEGEFSPAALEEIAIQDRVEDVVRATNTSVAGVARTIRSCANDLAVAFDELSAQARGSLSEATIELGICVSGEGNVFVVKGSAEANLTVTLTWSFT